MAAIPPIASVPYVHLIALTGNELDAVAKAIPSLRDRDLGVVTISSALEFITSKGELK